MCSGVVCLRSQRELVTESTRTPTRTGGGKNAPPTLKAKTRHSPRAGSNGQKGAFKGGHEALQQVELKRAHGLLGHDLVAVLPADGALAIVDGGERHAVGVDGARRRAENVPAVQRAAHVRALVADAHARQAHADAHAGVHALVGVDERLRRVHVRLAGGVVVARVVVRRAVGRAGEAIEEGHGVVDGAARPRPHLHLRVLRALLAPVLRLQQLDVKLEPPLPQLLHHPRQRDVGRARVLVRAADVGVAALEPHLREGLAGQRRRQLPEGG